MTTTKPFNYEHARAGAPVATNIGTDVQVLIWDRKHPTHPILAIELCDEHEAFAFTLEGNRSPNFYRSELDHLVMKPLGYIDDKPVFVGDELEQRDRHNESWVPRTAQPSDRDFSISRWPAPKREYPATTMTDEQIAQAAYAAPVFNQWRGIINAALRHAIDAGQVMALPLDSMMLRYDLSPAATEGELRKKLVEMGWTPPATTTSTPPNEHAEAAYWRFDARRKGIGDWSGAPMAERDAFKAEYRGAIISGQQITEERDQRIEQLRATVSRQAATIAELKADREARDMAVADAVRDACRKMFETSNVVSDATSPIRLSQAYGRCSTVNLADVIAAVK